jgi:tetratricopeptide (TPR) repeat protein
MNKTSRIGLIITAMLISPFIGAVEFDDAQKCNEVKDDPDLTIQYCTTAIQSGKLSTENLVLAKAKRGYAYYKKRNYDQALSDFNAVIRLDPNIARIYIKRGMAYEYSERNYDETIDNFNSAIRLKPNNARYYNYRCWALVLKGDAESALSDCNKSLELQPDDPNTFDSRGLAHFALGNYQAALKDFNRTIQLDSSAWSTHLNKARVLEILGNTSQAEADRNISRKNAQGEEQYASWLRNVEDAEKNNQHHR